MKKKPLIATLPMLILLGLIAGAIGGLGVAALSWTLIEKRALALKDDFASATTRAFNLGLAKIGGVAR